MTQSLRDKLFARIFGTSKANAAAAKVPAQQAAAKARHKKESPAPPPEELLAECKDHMTPFHCRIHCKTRTKEVGRQEYSSIEAPSTSRHAAIIHVALLLTGKYDSSHGKSGINPLVMNSWKTQFLHGVMDLHPQATLDTFICNSGPMTIFGKGEEPWQPDWSAALESPRSRVFQQPYDNRSTTDQYVRMEGCYLAALAHEAAAHRDNGHARANKGSTSSPAYLFTHFVRARFDLRWFGPVPRFAFAQYKVSIRARKLLFADECSKLDVNALAVEHTNPGSNACGVSRGGFKAGLNKTTRKSNVMLTGALRDKMRAHGVPICASVDDMFAIVPRLLGDAFFLRPESLRERHPMMPLFGWNVTRSHRTIAAVEALYGAESVRGLDVGADVPITRETANSPYGLLCGPVPFVGGVEVGHGGAAEHASYTAERRITNRLHARLVPLEFAALPFNSAPYGKGHRANNVSAFC